MITSRRFRLKSWPLERARNCQMDPNGVNWNDPTQVTCYGCAAVEAEEEGLPGAMTWIHVTLQKKGR